MSIKPRFAELIVAGEKSVELRRRWVNLSEGDRVLLYASSPVKAIIGSFVVEQVERLPLEQLWRRTRATSQVSKAEFDAYFSGLDVGIAIRVSEPRRSRHQPLSTLRKRWPGFHPPQVLRFVDQAATAH